MERISLIFSQFFLVSGVHTMWVASARDGAGPNESSRLCNECGRDPHQSEMASKRSDWGLIRGSFSKAMASEDTQVSTRSHENAASSKD